MPAKMIMTQENTAPERKNDSDSIRLTDRLRGAYLTELSRQGAKPSTVQTYSMNIDQLRNYLGAERRIRKDTPREWRDHLRRRGYSVSTINTKIAALNSLLLYCGQKGWTLSLDQTPDTPDSESLTRTEYLRLLQAARALGEERGYLLIKLCGAMGLAQPDLQQITVDAVRSGALRVQVNMKTEEYEQRQIPQALHAELLGFVKRKGFRTGLVFRGRNGKRLARQQILKSIQKPCHAAGLPESKCSPRTLKKLYQDTYTEIEARYTRQIRQDYEDLLRAEQEMAGWESEFSPEAVK